MALMKTVLRKVVYSVVGLVMLSSVLFIGPVLAGFVALLVVLMSDRFLLQRERSEGTYLGVVIVVFLATAALTWYTEYRTHYAERTIDRIGARLGIRVKRESKPVAKLGDKRGQINDKRGQPPIKGRDIEAK